jgi:hypothetical protein
LASAFRRIKANCFGACSALQTYRSLQGKAALLRSSSSSSDTRLRSVVRTWTEDETWTAAGAAGKLMQGIEPRHDPQARSIISAQTSSQFRNSPITWGSYRDVLSIGRIHVTSTSSMKYHSHIIEASLITVSSTFSWRIWRRDLRSNEKPHLQPTWPISLHHVSLANLDLHAP